jgi:acid phosphatase type 7
MALAVVTASVIGLVASGSASAAYGIFGSQSEGLGYYEAGSGFKRVSRFELTTPMTMLRLRAYLDGLGSGSGSQVARGVIYADAQGEPGALRGTSEQVTIADGQPVGWVDFKFTTPVTLAAGNYWLGLHFGGSSNTIRFRNTHGAGASRVQTFDTYADGASNPFGITYPYADPHSIYAVGAVAGFPIRAAFYYPSFPETWTVGGKPAHFTPSLGLYSSTDPAVQKAHIQALAYAGMDAAISSWAGQGHYTDTRLKSLLAQTTSGGSLLKWAIYYETQNRTTAQIAADLAYIRDNLATSPAYLRVGGKFVVFVHNSSATDATCAAADRWKQANGQVGNAAYVDLKVFTGFRLCASQPNGWHQYAPTARQDYQSGYSFSISPGFWAATESTPRLTRDPVLFGGNVRAMIASRAPWQLVTTFNQWSEGTAVESATEWSSASGYGIYLDALNAAAMTTDAHDPVIAGAGDIASGGSGDEATARLLDSLNPDGVFTLGDNAYNEGTASQFTNYYDPTWGRHKGKTRPAPGNHDYRTSGASGYFGYFGAAAGEQGKGYYSYDLGAWHLIALNTNSACTTISCAAGSAQEQWLRADLAAHPTACTLAYFHHPLFSAGSVHGDTPAVRPLVQALYDGGADVMLAGHDHNYQRFAAMTPSGALDSARGIRSFVVGTGGVGHYSVGSRTGLQMTNTDTFGVLKLTLHPTSYDWQFVPEAGKSFTDSGSGSCH